MSLILLSWSKGLEVGGPTQAGGEYTEENTSEITHFFALPLSHRAICFVGARETCKWWEPGPHMVKRFDPSYVGEEFDYPFH